MNTADLERMTWLLRVVGFQVTPQALDVWGTRYVLHAYRLDLGTHLVTSEREAARLLYQAGQADIWPDSPDQGGQQL